jgi:hypothetical protein
LNSTVVEKEEDDVDDDAGLNERVDGTEMV